MRTQYLTLLLTFVMLTGCTSTAKHYRVYGDGPSLYRLLHDDVHNGQSLEEVRSHLGPGNIPCDQERVRETHLRILTKAPRTLPDGVENTDQYAEWQYDGSPWITLQFRNDRLVNHNPQYYEKYSPFLSVR